MTEALNHPSLATLLDYWLHDSDAATTDKGEAKHDVIDRSPALDPVRTKRTVTGPDHRFLKEFKIDIGVTTRGEAIRCDDEPRVTGCVFGDMHQDIVDVCFR